MNALLPYNLQDTKRWEWSDTTAYDYKDWLYGYPSATKSAKDQCAALTQVVGADNVGVSVGWTDVNCNAHMKAVCKVARMAIYP